MAGNRYYQGPPSDHFDGTRFFNPGQAPTDRSLADMLRWQWGGTRAVWDKPGPTAPPVRPDPRVAGLAITMVGHASVLIQAAGHNILVDPVWSERASPFRFAGPRRVDPPGIAFSGLPPVDTVLLTHNHYDHCDLPTLARLAAAHRPRFITPLGNDALIAASAGARIETGDWGDRFVLAERLAVTLHPAHHWSARRIGDRRMALWCGFVLETPAGAVYLVGDTGYGDGVIFRQVRERFGPPLVAVIPIGAYEPRWFMRAQHVNPEEAVRIMLDCSVQQALGVHWGTFRLTDEARLEPPAALDAALALHGIEPGRFLALRPGAVWRL